MPKFFDTHENGEENGGGDVGNGSNNDRFSSECITCSFTGERTASLLVESLQWNFYYCYKCGNWFQRHFRFGNLAIPIRDKKMIRALSWYYNSQIEALENTPRISEQVKHVWGKFKEFYESIYTRFSE